MQEKELSLLFHEGVLTKCFIVQDIAGKGYNALFLKKSDKKPSESLETRPRKSGDPTQMRVFKTIDAACSLIKRQVGFNDFEVKI